MPAFDEVFQVSIKSRRWKCSLQEETRSLHVFVRKTFKVFHKREEEIFVLICIRTGGIWDGQGLPSMVPLERGEFTDGGGKYLHEGEEYIISSPAQLVMTELGK